MEVSSDVWSLLLHLQRNSCLAAITLLHTLSSASAIAATAAISRGGFAVTSVAIVGYVTTGGVHGDRTGRQTTEH